MATELNRQEEKVSQLLLALEQVQNDYMREVQVVQEMKDRCIIHRNTWEQLRSEALKLHKETARAYVRSLENDEERSSFEKVNDKYKKACNEANEYRCRHDVLESRFLQPTDFIGMCN